MTDMSDYPPVCAMCDERFAAEGERYCSGCLIHVEDDDDPACNACGSTLDWSGGCLCDLPAGSDRPYWMDRRA